MASSPVPIMEEEKLCLAEAVCILFPGLPQGTLSQPEDAPVNDKDDGYGANGEGGAPGCCQPTHELDKIQHHFRYHW